ncbi:MAG: hypothetical protein KIH69_002910 [Anaerolineae bacterium]|nr:hypothetical protein [Anaerolineae bacterium]
MTFDNLYLEHALAAFDKRIYLSAMHGSQHWELRLDLGHITYLGPHQQRQTYLLDALGTQSDTEGTWLWAWANPDMFRGEALLRSANALRQYGQTHGLREFCEPTLPITPTLTGQRIAAVASGLCRAGTQVRCAYPQGSAYFLIRDPKFKRPVQRPLARIARILPMFASDERQLHAQDYQSAFEHYLRFYRLKADSDVTPQGHRIYTVQPSGSANTLMGEGLQLGDAKPLVVEFDAARQFVRVD